MENDLRHHVLPIIGLDPREIGGRSVSKKLLGETAELCDGRVSVCIQIVEERR
jgi:hypothetical protein